MSLTAVAFLAMFAAGMLLALFRHPKFGLYTYTALFYLHPPSRWWADSLPDIRWSLVAAGVTIFATLRLTGVHRRAPWFSHLGAKTLVLCALWLWIQNLWALSPDAHFEASVLFSKYVVLFFVMYQLIRSPNDVRDFLLLHVLGCFYLGWLAFEAPDSGRLEGVGGPGIDEANALGMQLTTGVMAGAMLFLASGKATRWFVLFAMPLIVNGIVLCVSRSSFLALLFGGLVLTAYKPPTRRKLFYACASLALVLFLVLASQQFWERMGTMKSGVETPEEMDGSAMSRVYLAKAQFRIFLDHPLGVGHRGTELLTPTYSDEEFQKGKQGRSSHNTFLTMLSEQGVPGVIMFVMMVGWCLRTLSQLKERYGMMSAESQGQIAALGAALACILVGGLFVDYFKAEVQIWFFALLAAWKSFSESEISRGLVEPSSATKNPVGGAVLAASRD